MSLIIPRNFKRAKAQDAAADAKFKKGDKVVSVKTGAQGVVSEVYGEEKYAVLFNGAANPDRVEGFQIRLSNSHAADARGTDAKFKVGQIVHGKNDSSYNYKILIDHGLQRDSTGTHQTYLVLDLQRNNNIMMPENALAADAAEFHVGQRVRAKDPRWAGYQGHALGNGMYTVKKVDRDGTVKLDGFLDVWISPSALVEANDACGNRSK